LTLGVMAALGGFVDIGELVFTTQAGSKFGYHLIWAIVLGTIGIIVYAEMCGRVAAVAQEPVFSAVRDKLGFKLGLLTLIASNVVNLITCAAEIGGVAIVLQLLTKFSYNWQLVGTTLILIAIVWLLPFKYIEKSFGYAGLLMLVFVVVAVALRPNWHSVAWGLVPSIPTASLKDFLLYSYFVVGIMSSVMMPYEVYFYSSGGIEEDWDIEDLNTNTVIANIGFGLGSIVAIALLVIGAALFLPLGISPQQLATTASSGAFTFGKLGLLLALLGMLFTISGAAVETCLAGAYNVAQFFNFPWGRQRKPLETPRFTVSWIVIFLLAMAIVLTGIDPVKLVEYSVIFAVVVLPLTYLPILLVARDPGYMHEHVNKRWDNILGWTFLAIVTLCGLAAVPLMIITHGGQG
jgi:manganese transport protein